MADEGGELTFPNNSTWSEWNFGQIVVALTGDTVDLESAAKATWLTFSEQPGESDNISYHAFENESGGGPHYYYGVKYNEEAFRTWNESITTMNEVMAGLGTGRRGAMDLTTLLDAAALITNYTKWVESAAGDYRTWAKGLDSDDAWQGNAAGIIETRTESTASALEDVYEQLSSRNGMPMAQALFDLYETMLHTARTLAAAWQEIAPKIQNEVADFAKKLISEDIHQYIGLNGIVKSGEFADKYRLDDIAQSLGMAKAKEHIDNVMSQYSEGDLRQATTWDKLNQRVSGQVTPYLEQLDQVGQQAMARLEPVMTTAATAITLIGASTDAGGAGGAGASGVPDPTLTELPPITDVGGTLTDPNAIDTSLPDPNAGVTDTSLPDPNAIDSSLPDPNSGLADTSLTDPNAGAVTDLPPVDTGAGSSGLGADGTDIAPLPPVGTATVGTPGTSRDRDAGAVTTPSLDPPGGVSEAGLDDPALSGAGAGLDDLRVPGGTSGLDDPALTGAGAGLGDLAVPGAGAADDGIGAAASSGLDTQDLAAGDQRAQAAGTPGTGAAGSGFSSGAGSGSSAIAGLPNSQLSGTPMGMGGMGSGMPMMPMGGGGMGGGQGDQNKERERQTWLSEDESVWGTNSGDGVGVIGRPDDEDYDEAEEFSVVAGPAARVSRPVQPKPAEAEQNAEQQAGA